MGCDHNASGFRSGEQHFLNRRAFEISSNAAVTSTFQWIVSTPPNQVARYLMSLPDWKNTLKATVLPKPPGGGVRLKGLGVVLGIVIAAVAIFVLTHTIKNIDYNEVFAVVRRTHPGLIVLAAMLVATSYISLTLYDLLALRTIGRPDVPSRTAALAR